MPKGIYNHRKTKTPIYTKERNEKISKTQTGKKLSKKTKEKMSKIRKGKPILKLRGRWLKEKNPNWKGGITPKNKKIRSDVHSSLWRGAVFARDNWTCQKCKERGGELNPHHILNFSQYLELRFAIDNGITFCKECHKSFHKKYGRQNNTKEQLKEFIR